MPPVAGGACRSSKGHTSKIDPTTTLRYYVKVIPENQRKAGANFERSVMKKRAKRRSKAEPNR
ncbi:MAG: hypothetical protein ABSC05_37820 [Candidatus Solibacter sp.]|jgi:hypothetical protein